MAESSLPTRPVSLDDSAPLPKRTDPGDNEPNRPFLSPQSPSTLLDRYVASQPGFPDDIEPRRPDFHFRDRLRSSIFNLSQNSSPALGPTVSESQDIPDFKVSPVRMSTAPPQLPVLDVLFSSGEGESPHSSQNDDPILQRDEPLSKPSRPKFGHEGLEVVGGGLISDEPPEVAPNFRPPGFYRPDYGNERPAIIRFREPKFSLSRITSFHHDVESFEIYGQDTDQCRIFFSVSEIGYRVFEVEACPYEDVHVDETLAVWETLLICCDKLLRYSSQQMLREHGDLPRDLLRSLIKVADLTNHLEITYADMQRYLRHDYHDHPDVINRLDTIIETEKQLTRKIDVLIQRASNIMSIDEAYKTREQGASIKRLTWINFIFLPLLFVSGLFGMNIDILENNPPWWNYFWVLLPTSAIVIFLVLFLKNRKKVVRSIRTQGDEESQIGPPRSINKRILLAVEMGHDVEVQRLLRSGASVNYRGSDGKTPIMFAAKNGHIGLVKLLLNNKKISCHHRDNNGYTALHWAVYGGSFECVRVLVEDGRCDVDITDNFGLTAAHLAAGFGQELVVRFLTTYGQANLSLQNTAGHTPLHLAVQNGYLYTVSSMIQDGKVNLSITNTRGQTPLHTAYQSAVDALISPSPVPPAHRWEIASIILNATIYWKNYPERADINTRDTLGNTILHLLCDYDFHFVRSSLTELLHTGRANIDAPDNSNRTPLVRAIIAGKSDTAIMLITEWSADIDTQDSQEWTALHHAADNNMVTVVETLVKVGRASVGVKNRKGDTALDIARRKDNSKVVKVLERVERTLKRRGATGVLALPDASDVLAAKEVVGAETAAGDESDTEYEESGEKEEEEDGSEEEPDQQVNSLDSRQKHVEVNEAAYRASDEGKEDEQEQSGEDNPLMSYSIDV